jgi:hypothetical protein
LEQSVRWASNSVSFPQLWNFFVVAFIQRVVGCGGVSHVG